MKSLLNVIYQTVTEIKNKAYARGFFRQHKLSCPVISVGNISFGGSGKTPTIQFLLEKILQNKKVCVVSRSYKAALKGPEPLPEIDLYTAYEMSKKFGDEPVLIKMKWPQVSVWSGPRKWETAKAAEKALQPQIILVDDGFSHRALYRDLDIVLIDVTRFENEWKREFLSSLQRTQVVLLTRAQMVSAQVLSQLQNELTTRFAHLKGKIFTTRMKLKGDENLKGPLFLFCAVGHPESVQKALLEKNKTVLFTEFFTDHHQYSEFDENRLWTLWQERKAERKDLHLVTTAKDALKIKNKDLLKSLHDIDYDIELSESDERALNEIIRPYL